MNRKNRRELVKKTPKGKIDKWGLVVNSKPITAILVQRVEFVLKEYGIQYYIIDNRLKSDNPQSEKIYDSEAEKLLNELKLLRGDYKKLKIYE